MASVARYCCCGGCPALEMTITGIDAAACCWTNGYDAFNLDTPLGIDGTYSVVGVPTLVGGVCTYQFFSGVSGILRYRIADPGDCTGIIQSGCSHTFGATVKYDTATAKVTEVIIDSSSSCTLALLENLRLFTATGLSTSLGVAISNQETVCTASMSSPFFKALTPGGSITISTA